MWGFTWRVSDCEEFVGILLGDCLTCEELSGGYSQEMMGLFFVSDSQESFLME